MKLNLKDVERAFEDCNKDYEVVVKHLQKLYNLNESEVTIFESCSDTVIYIRGKYLCTVDCILEDVINGY